MQLDVIMKNRNVTFVCCCRWLDRGVNILFECLVEDKKLRLNMAAMKESLERSKVIAVT